MFYALRTPSPLLRCFLPRGGLSPLEKFKALTPSSSPKSPYFFSSSRLAFSLTCEGRRSRSGEGRCKVPLSNRSRSATNLCAGAFRGEEKRLCAREAVSQYDDKTALSTGLLHAPLTVASCSCPPVRLQATDVNPPTTRPLPFTRATVTVRWPFDALLQRPWNLPTEKPSRVAR